MKLISVGLITLFLVVGINSCKKNSNNDRSPSENGDDDTTVDPGTLATDMFDTTVDPGTLATDMFYTAENIIFPTANAQGEETYPGIDESNIDRETKIPASNVLLIETPDAESGLFLSSSEEKSIGRLKSKNLKDALNDELAFDVYSLAGTTWDVENKVEAGSNGFTQSGRITFVDNSTVDIVFGTVEALGHAPTGGGEWCQRTQYKIEIIAPLMAVLTPEPAISSIPNKSALYISVVDKNNIVLVGQPACGFNSLDKVSVLTQVIE